MNPGNFWAGVNLDGVSCWLAGKSLCSMLQLDVDVHLHSCVISCWSLKLKSCRHDEAWAECRAALMKMGVGQTRQPATVDLFALQLCA